MEVYGIQNYDTDASLKTKKFSSSYFLIRWLQIFVRSNLFFMMHYFMHWLLVRLLSKLLTSFVFVITLSAKNKCETASLLKTVIKNTNNWALAPCIHAVQFAQYIFQSISQLKNGRHCCKLEINIQVQVKIILELIPNSCSALLNNNPS